MEDAITTVLSPPFTPITSTACRDDYERRAKHRRILDEAFQRANDDRQPSKAVIASSAAETEARRVAFEAHLEEERRADALAAYALAPPEVVATMASLCTLAAERLGSHGAPQLPTAADEQPIAHEQPPTAATTLAPDMHSTFFSFEAAASDAEPISTFAEQFLSAGPPAQNATVGDAQPPTHAPMPQYVAPSASDARRAHASMRRARAHTQAHGGVMRALTHSGPAAMRAASPQASRRLTIG